eukprot:Amastigsp_a842561_41.p6 type:complete len:100 gc:universal Amastigsp_a842561_41:614-913(+)
MFSSRCRSLLSPSRTARRSSMTSASTALRARSRPRCALRRSSLSPTSRITASSVRPQRSAVPPQRRAASSAVVVNINSIRERGGTARVTGGVLSAAARP